MAFLYRRGSGPSYEIRESESTPRGPRSRTLLSFRGVLTREQLAQARQRARGAFDAEALVERARELAVPVRDALEPELRALIAKLRAGVRLDPVLLGLLRELLDGAQTREPPVELAEAAEWIGASAAERGRALRGLLRVTDRIVASRPDGRKRRVGKFPRFQSRRTRRAA